MEKASVALSAIEAFSNKSGGVLFSQELVLQVSLAPALATNAGAANSTRVLIHGFQGRMDT